MKNVIEIKNLEKRFGSVQAVKDVSLVVSKGEIFGFLGENGAGKTTTIRCLMDFIRPTSGSISIFGKDSHLESVFLKSKIGFLPGNVRLYDKWTGREHIEFVESLRGKSKFSTVLTERLKLNQDIKFRNLSSGNKQKLGLILALMNEPELLIMDEPTIGLDPLLQNEIYKILLELKKQGTTIFLSSHNLSEVERICDRAGVIKEGKIIAIETISNLAEIKMYEVMVKVKEKTAKANFKIAGVEEIQEAGDGLKLKVSGDINPILKVISQHEISDIGITRVNLEEVFLKFYGRKK